MVSDGDVPIDDVMASMANSCWKITKDELDVNTKLVNYLDVTIANPGPIVKVWPAYKETALLRRLGLESAHAPFVHRSWIRAMFRRVEKRCLRPFWRVSDGGAVKSNAPAVASNAFGYSASLGFQKRNSSGSYLSLQSEDLTSFPLRREA